ncbi:MAG: isocitrate/isopropylmalate family dehydrogenase, partial [Aeromonas sp.]
TSVILASVQMLEYLGMQSEAERILNAVRTTIEAGETVTRDLGGNASTSDFTDAVIARL